LKAVALISFLHLSLRHAYDPCASAKAKAQGGLACAWAWAQARPGLGLGLGVGLGLGLGFRPELFAQDPTKQPQNNSKTITKQLVFTSCFASSGGSEEEVPKSLSPETGTR